MINQEDQFMKNMAKAIFASYIFYAPVILFVAFVRAIGSLMIFKTIAYLAMACLALRKFYLNDEELEGWNRIILKAVFKLSLVDMMDFGTKWPKIGSETQ